MVRLLVGSSQKAKGGGPEGCHQRQVAFLALVAVGVLVVLEYTLDVKVWSLMKNARTLGPVDSSVKKMHIGDDYHGVRPLRRFRIKPNTGVFIEQLNLTAAADDHRKLCNQACWDLPECDAWESRDRVTVLNDGTTEAKVTSTNSILCDLYRYRLPVTWETSTEATNQLAAWQAEKNHPGFTVGFIQRHAQVLRMAEEAEDEDTINIRDRILYVLHYHDKPHTATHLPTLINEILPGYLPAHAFDLVVITPEPVALPVNHSHATTLVNPTSYHGDIQLPNGANSQWSVNIAQAKFPGYKGYLLVNDDAHIRMWDLLDKKDYYLGDRPWGTFPVFWGEGHSPIYEGSKKPLELPRIILNRYPYGNTLYGDWGWWAKDSGRVDNPKGETRSNFEAALAALNEFCARPSLKQAIPTVERRTTFCDNRDEHLLAPYVHGKADVFYVPTNWTGSEAFLEAIQLFSSHDVMLEITVVMVYNLLVPVESFLSIPYCDCEASKNNIQQCNQPYYQRKGEPFQDMTCTVVHPIKLSKPENVAHWQNTVQAECGSGCRGYGKVNSTGSGIHAWQVIRATREKTMAVQG